MGPMLAVHLGFVPGFFLTMPYGRFVHGLYRFATLVRYAMEQRAEQERHAAPVERPRRRLRPGASIGDVKGRWRLPPHRCRRPGA